MDPTPSTSSASIPKHPFPPPPSSPASGVVVVGFVGRRCSDVYQLLNRIIDSNVFGSGNRDNKLLIEEKGSRVRVSYYCDEVKGIVYLAMCGAQCPVVRGGVGEEEEEEDIEGEELRALLLMFMVCHVIVYVQEGSRFRVELLREFRVLQSAKNALTPLVKTRNKQVSSSGPSSSPSSARASSKNVPGRGGSYQYRHSSSTSDMANVGLYTSLFPGQCTPVVLFAFIDDFSEMVTSATSTEEPKDASSFNQISSMSSLVRSGFPGKGSGSVVVLARPTNKSEGGSRRKLQSSLEAQIRFLIKKCRTLSSSEVSHAGSRNRVFSGALPLLILDSSRSVVLIDSCTNQSSEVLSFVTGLVEDVFSGKATPDSLLLESLAQKGNKEDIGSLKEFISRQADIIRGKGGITTANSGSAAGVGMVAAAAAAAAASAASRRSRSSPELPSLPIWLSHTQDILKGLLSAQRLSVDDVDINRRRFRQRNGAPPLDGPTLKGADPQDVAVSLLEDGKGINSMFSTSWCQRAFPAALEVYLKDLPAYYPTSLHEAHLEKALRAFKSMVKGTSVKDFMKKLEDECTSIWKYGRQSCDAVSLTGRPCAYPRHDLQDDSDSKGKQHSSELVFLHACACGRARRPRPDPFDFESANVTFNCSLDCDKLIPIMQLPKASDGGSVELFPWHIVRVGDSGYYDPSKGLPQSGFSTNQKFLLKWAFNVEKDKVPNISYGNAIKQGPLGTSANTNHESRLDVNMRKDVSPKANLEVDSRIESQRSTLEQSNDGKISFGLGLPNITMMKPFAEVVAGSASTKSAFPPLQTKKPATVAPEKGPKKSLEKDGSAEKTDTAFNHKKSVKVEMNASNGEKLNDIRSIGSSVRKPFLQIGSNVVPLNVDDGRNTRLNLCSEQIIVYVGFEHECPRGHRFILSLDLLNELGSPYSSVGETNISSAGDDVHHRHRDPLKLAMNSSYDKLHMALNDSAGTIHKERNFSATGEIRTRRDLSTNGPLYLSEPEKEHYDASSDASVVFDSCKDHSAGLKDLDNCGHFSSLLNRDLPVYMNCPQCRIYNNKKDKRTPKFAGTVSQLQRIFVVTPPLPVVLATDAVVQFEGSCQPLNFSNHKQLQFSPGCQVILPPESFISIRLPFIYGVQVENTGLQPLKPFDQRPEITAWIQRGTALRLISKGSIPD